MLLSLAQHLHTVVSPCVYSVCHLVLCLQPAPARMDVVASTAHALVWHTLCWMNIDVVCRQRLSVMAPM
jgi:hypothetical protein